MDDRLARMTGSLDTLGEVVRDQVRLILERASAERKAVLEDVTAQRLAALQAFHTERTAALAAIDSSIDRTVAEVFSRADARLSGAIFWAAPAAALALILLALLVWATARQRLSPHEGAERAAGKETGAGIAL